MSGRPFVIAWAGAAMTRVIRIAAGRMNRRLMDAPFIPVNPVSPRAIPECAGLQHCKTHIDASLDEPATEMDATFPHHP